MNSESFDGQPQEPVAPPGHDPSRLDAWFVRNLDQFTPEALTAAAAGAGYTAERIAKALARAEANRDAGPVASRARRIVLASYGLVYLILLAGLLGYPHGYGLGQIGAIVLTVVLGLALALALWWLRRPSRTATIGTLLAVPIILLLVLGGACVYTTGSPVQLIRQLLGYPPSF